MSFSLIEAFWGVSVPRAHCPIAARLGITNGDAAADREFPRRAGQLSGKG